jgi:chromate transporter
VDSAIHRPSLTEVSRFFLWLGAVSWGGMYAILPRVKTEVSERGWMPAEDFGPLMAAATLVPGPSFVSMAGLIGYRTRGAVGSLVAMISLLIPPTVLVSGALIFLASGPAMGALAPAIRLVTVAMAGVLLGNAWKLMSAAPMRAMGLLLFVATGAAVLAGLSVVWTVIIALLAGRLLLGGERA